VDIDEMDKWYEYRKILPRLSTLVMDIFCVYTSSGFSENYVFTAGDITNPVQTILDYVATEELIF
jgi:hypothetical protein